METTSYIIAEPGNPNQLQQQIDDTIAKRKPVEQKLKDAQKNLAGLEDSYNSKKSGLFSMFSKKETVEKLGVEVEEAKKQVAAIQAELDSLTVNIDKLQAGVEENQHRTLADLFASISQSKKVWNISLAERHAGKSAAKASFNRNEIALTTADIAVINSKYKPFLFKNTYGGADLYIYPGMALQLTQAGQAVVYEMKNVKFTFHPARFIENEQDIPQDTKVIDQVWNKVNKDGSPDLRFSDNFQRPVVRYGQMSFSVGGGSDISYHISNYEHAENFAKTFMQVVQPAGAMITASGEKIAGKGGVTTNVKSEFSEQYYDLLVNYVDDVKLMYDKLSADNAFLSGLNLPSPMTGPMYIQSSMVYDLCQVLKNIVDETGHKKGLETAGLTFMACYIRPDNIDPLGKGYATVATAYNQNIYATVTNSILSIVDQPKIVTIPGEESVFSLLPVLRVFNNPMAEAYANFLYQCANIYTKADNTVSKEEEEKLKHVYQLIHAKPAAPGAGNTTTSAAKPAQNAAAEAPAETIESILAEINSLIGLEDVKKEINTLVNFIRVQKARESSGLKASSISYHIVFTGNPGTGKTTVARIIAKIYKALGVLSGGQLIETDRSGMIGEYVGHTAPKVNKVVDSALHGILFIDEAYAIAGEGNDFGKEAVATLIKRMEDDRDKLVVIMAGYTNEMGNFIETNPGFKSRFNRYIEFSDYGPVELLAIFKSMCAKAEYTITDGAVAKLQELFEKAYANKDKTFGNARFVRNVYEKSLEMQANRIAAVTNLTKEVLTTIEAEDIPQLKD